ncbi:MAG: hypothetical protein B6D63_04805 [Candidatus Latescibacteria bacterium 4484_7]|nr:MAG: hypothetical protein B6D63_04805 [Candidatus Latescibacteria bacterium 4484_7]
MRFATPWAFLLFAALPVLYLIALKFHRPGSVGFSSVANAKRAGASLRTRLARLPLILRTIVLILLIIALARPQQGREKVKDVTKGIAIEMVLDRSGSMGTEMSYMGRRLNRLQVVKKVFQEFLMGNGKMLKGRPNDLVGMIAFARYADTIAPLTLEHGALLRFMETLHVVKRRSEDGTAIGDAIALAAARLKTAEEELARFNESNRGEGGDTYKIKSKVIILLTDGQNNYGKRTPQEAAKLAAKWGIKIYAIGVGGREGVATVQTLFGTFKVPGGGGVDEATLKNIADITGGMFRMAGNEKALRKIYEEIDKMEKSEVESVRYIDYKERFMDFAVAAMIILLIEVVLSNTLLRRIP